MPALVLVAFNAVKEEFPGVCLPLNLTGNKYLE